MTCPDWEALVAARDAAPAAELPAWAEARRHAADCSRCRGAALAVDPLLLFTRLPERSVSPGEIADMQFAVAALVRSSRVVYAGQASHLFSASKRADSGGSGLRPSVRSATRVAAALGICSLLALSGTPRTHSPGLGAFVAAGSLLLEEATAVGDAAPLRSVVEQLDRPGARIYELPQADMLVVLIVDANLDV